METKFHKIVVVFRIIQSLFLVFLLISGIGSMPSILGMLFLMMAVLVSPRKLWDFMMEEWWQRLIWIGMLLYYIGTIPPEDASTAGQNMGRYLHCYYELFCSWFQ